MEEKKEIKTKVSRHSLGLPYTFIPKEITKELKLRKGDKLLWAIQNGKIVLKIERQTEKEKLWPWEIEGDKTSGGE
jgi:antitoxin component of MazEF toxin-antitoxin module